MKLISCYIENFGGLSRYALEFADGVTVIQEANGFGKTTLAEFLRAMFYGFPRKTKTLDKSKRQKYTPWNGGKCGGNLTFEQEGVCYRLERTFGATPRSDTFSLIDLATGKKSTRFSEEIGLELFQLDADSFERSTYMPQIHDTVTLTTTGIQAKLGDLVEDTSDLGNFDKAMQVLKSRRSALVPYRGSGGTVAEAASRVSRIQRELDDAQAQKAQLEHCAAEIAQARQRIQEIQTETDSARKQWNQASKAEAARQRYEELTAARNSAAEVLDTLQEKYPSGIPGEAEIESARQMADHLAVLEAQQVTTQADLDALKIVEENQARFETHLPEQAELEKVDQNCDRYAMLVEKAKDIGMTAAEKKQYETLCAVFGSGELDEAALDDLTERSRMLLRQRAALESLTVPEEDRRRMSELNAMFPQGLPTDEEIRHHRQLQECCDAIRQENERLNIRMEIAAQQKRNPLPAILVVLGILCPLLGIVRQFAVGVLAGIGVLLLAAGVMMLLRQRRDRAELLAALRTKIAGNEAEIAACENAVGEFTGGTTLEEMQRSREDALNLNEKLRLLREKRAAREAEVRQNEDELRRRLSRYFRQVSDFDRAISDLRLARSQYLELRRKKAGADEELRRLNERIAELEAEITAFLSAYFQEVRPEWFDQLLNTLRRDADAYARAREQAAQWRQRKDLHEQLLGRCAAELDAFFAAWNLRRSPDVRKQLQQLWDDGKLLQSAAQRREQLTEQLKQFPEIPEVAADPEILKDRERQLNEEFAELTEKLMQHRQTQRELQAQADRIPELWDELERWQEKKTSDQEKSGTLDDTMDFLQKARESLTTSYLGPIRERFAGYMTRLNGADEKAFISSELDVQLERLGQARELAYFSAGQTDLIVLCMRLALVDALFKDAKPFVILDDPFVNLDDERTAEALELLKELGKDRQIIYLTCNSSRSL